MSGGNTFVRVRFRTDGRKAFTLIELLVVISILVLLMALLFPALSRARKQARAVVCQANLRQWGALRATSVSENDGRFPTPDWDDPHYREAYWGTGYVWGWGTPGDRDQYEATEGIRCCPMATKPASRSGQTPPAGGTFLAWGRLWRENYRPEPWYQYDSYGSYGFNHAVGSYWFGNETNETYRERAWRTVDVRGRDRIPVQFDSAWPWADYGHDSYRDPPPECDAIPTVYVRIASWLPSCIDRHAGGINAVFLDWSVRKVGLKELWTLKWDRKYHTTGPWTKAGGALPEDWPKWMRKFKDY